jgi:hypothetical protein
MSQILTATAPLWKPGNKGNIEFLSSFKRLQKEDPDLYAKIEQKDGFAMQEGEYEYRTGTSRFGLWLSRRRMGLEGLRQLEDKPPVRPPMADTPRPTASDELVQMIGQLVASINELKYSINTQVFSDLVSTPEEREAIKARIHKQEGNKMVE